MSQDKSRNESGTGAHLPDSERRTGPFKPFASDPGLNEAWWWLALPAILAISLIGIQNISSDFYQAWILPEGYGFLEFSQFLIAASATAFALKLAFRPYVRSRPLLFAFLCLAALGCFYIAGEETSWGQQLFNWRTPEYWAAINRQQETNLHNTIGLFGKKPRAVLEIGILVGGLILPALAVFYPAIRKNRWSLFIPPGAIVPVALGAALFKSTDALLNRFHITPLVMRPSEAIEIYLYSFLLFFLIMFARRIGELERE